MSRLRFRLRRSSRRLQVSRRASLKVAPATIAKTCWPMAARSIILLIASPGAACQSACTARASRASRR
eukprot:13362680-Alexandrium_andersonii.AAC.1